ncbi:MAG: zf-HC2 domain-containing protein [Acidobacteriota bacterium]
MKKCIYEDLIDDYLLNRLSQADRDTFEEHYFNCQHCSEQLLERDELFSVIKKEGARLFKDVYNKEATQKPSWRQQLTGALTSRQWAVAAASAAFFLIIAIGLSILYRPSPPRFFINEDQVRGESITLISPVIDIKTIPSEFRWTSLGENVVYRVYIYNHELLWSTETRENSITLPQEVKEKMTAGERYSWQVKAFSEEGALISVSSRVQFKVEQP